jgi:hypothetical protein
VHEFQIRPRAEFGFRESECTRPRRIEPLEVPVEVGDAEQIGRERKESIEFFLRAAALDELADLTADRAQHREQHVVRLADLAAEEFHRAERDIAKHDRKAERGVQLLAGRYRRPREVAVLQDVGDERRLPRRPYASRQPHAALEQRSAAERLELVESRAGQVPDRDATEYIPFNIDAPEGAVLPIERRANRLEDAWRGVREARRLGQYPCRGVLGRHPSLGGPAVTTSSAGVRRHAGRDVTAWCCRIGAFSMKPEERS